MVAVAASPTPGAAAAAPTSGKPNHHPPYKTMILNAIEALNDPKGSSRKAIFKFIADNYSGLPTTHAALLTHHLRRLHHTGDLTMLKHSFKLSDPSPAAAVGSRKRGRPPKNPNPSSSEIAPRRRGRPSNPRAPAEIDPASVYILPQAEQLRSGFLQSLPGAVAIILPEGLLSRKTGRSPVLILPNGVQSLVDASGSRKKMGRPRKEMTEKKRPDDLKEAEKIRTVRPRRKAVVSKQLLLHNGRTNDDDANAAVRKRGRPRKNKNSVLAENSAVEDPTMVKVVQDKPNSPGSELKKKAVGKNFALAENSLPKSSTKIVQDKPNSAGSELKKKSVGRPRKTATPNVEAS